MTVRVLLVADDEETAHEVATRLETAGGSIGVDLSVTAGSDPAVGAGTFDCLVAATTGPMIRETSDALSSAHPETPMIWYLDGELGAEADWGSPDGIVQWTGPDSALVLAGRVDSVTGAGRGGRGRRQVSAALDSVEEAVFTLDDDWVFTYLNEGAERLLEQPSEALLGESIWDVFAAAVGSTFYDECHAAVATGEPTTFEAYYEPLDRWFEVSAYPEGAGLVVFFRDVTDSRRQEDALSGVLETTRALMQARTREEVGELVATAAENTLGFEYNTVRLYDADSGTLEPVGWTDAVVEEIGPPPTYDLGEEPAGAVFASGEAKRYEDASEIPDDRDRGAIVSAIHLPVGVHGTISIGADEPAAFGDVEQQVAEILATNAAVAFSRAKREQEAREARDRVERLLTRINGLVQDTLEVLVQATTREEIETGVCERLTDADPYAFAWIGTADVTGEELTASAADGIDAFDVGSYHRELTDERRLDASARALEERQRQVVPDLTDTDDPSAPDAAAAGLGSLCAVPLIYRDTVYGVLTVYADRPDAFDEREQVLLSALGRSIADAINAVESGRILSTDRVIEMELSSRDPELLFSRLSAQADCRIESTGTLYEDDGSLRVYVAAETGDSEMVQSVLDGDDTVTESTHIVTHEGRSLFEVVVGSSIVEVLADYGAVTNGMVGEDGVTTVTLELPYEADARDVYDLLGERYDDVDLVSYHEHDRPVQTREEFQAALRDRFTDRQATALRSAYLGGFFEWPREVDGDELADSMDITRPTYHQHLRTAERKVFEELFD